MKWEGNRESDNVEDRRQRWFDTGLKTGSLKACDTFSARNI